MQIVQLNTYLALLLRTLHPVQWHKMLVTYFAWTNPNDPFYNYFSLRRDPGHVAIDYPFALWKTFGGSLSDYITETAQQENITNLRIQERDRMRAFDKISCSAPRTKWIYNSLGRYPDTFVKSFYDNLTNHSTLATINRIDEPWVNALMAKLAELKYQ